MIRTLMIGALVLLSASPALAQEQEESYYQRPGLFSTRPGETASETTITRYGPVGISIDLIQPAFTMRVRAVEEGSPAEAAGFQPGMIIESINGQVLADIDPRIQLGHILHDAEATDGVMRFAIQGRDDDIVITLPVLGAYSETWPLDCERSEAIVRAHVDYLRTEDANRGFAGIAFLFLVSTGEAEDLELAREWLHNGQFSGNTTYPWYIGYGGIGLCEYYLRTGDEFAMPIIQQMVNNVVGNQYMDGWAGRGGVLTNYGQGHLNAAGTHCVTFLLLAKECGADVPDHAMLGALEHFFRYAGRGNNPYGDDRPERGFVDNGKNGLLAFALAAAVSLMPDGEDSIYAQARDWCANTGFYSTAFMLHGHTGGGIGELWRSASMAFLHDTRPAQYRNFMDERQWHYDMSRRYDGSFAILGGSGYDKVQWGAAYPLAYTLPRGHLRIFGAPPTEHSHTYELPERIWGTAADDEFYLLTPVPGADGNVADLSGETIADDAAMNILRDLHGAEPPTDALILDYLHHPYSSMRWIAACEILGIQSGHYGQTAGSGGEVRVELAMQMLQHDSPRIRREMFAAVARYALAEDSPLYTEQVLGFAIAALSDAEESWWVKDAALHMVGQFPADWVRPHLDVLMPYLEHHEAWLRSAAMVALTPLADDPESYERVLPAIAELVRTNQRFSVVNAPLRGIRAQLQDAPPEVLELAIEVFADAFTDYAGVLTAEGGQNITTTYNFHMDFIAQALADIPGGVNVLYAAATEQNPDQALPYQSIILNTDPSEYGPELNESLQPILLEQVIPEYIGRNWTTLNRLAAVTDQRARPGGSHPLVSGASVGEPLDQLAAFYARAGQTQYQWEMFLDLRNEHWHYHSFEVAEEDQVPWDVMRCRYREITMPQGLEQWYGLDFDPADAGWPVAPSPFGQWDGEIPDFPIQKNTVDDIGPISYGGTPINTLWEHEVLLFRQTLELPEFEEGYRYRIRVNSGDQPGAGGGYAIYINGEQLIEHPNCNGRGHGYPVGAFITADFIEQFNGEPVTIAVISFIRYNDKFLADPTEEIRRGVISIHFERQLIPPMSLDMVLASASTVPMLTSTWQANQGAGAEEGSNEPAQPSNEGLFHYDGEFVNDPNAVGDWRFFRTTYDIGSFHPDEPQERGIRNNFGNHLNLHEGGRTNNELMIWTNGVILNLSRYEATRMVVWEIDGVEYLFVEAGRFDARNEPGWQCGWLVYRRAN